MKVYIETLGCPKNISDSETAAGVLEKDGFTIVEDPEAADVIIVNTCGFINDAKRESINMILDMAEYRNSGKLLVVSGCLSQRFDEELFREIPEIDILIGVNDYLQLPEILHKHIYGKRDIYQKTYDKEYEEIAERKLLETDYSAYLKISEGCDNICAYCVIPAIRGGYRSRKCENIVNDAKMLAETGVKELVLVAQDVTAYGIDIYGEYRLPKLLTELCGIEGIRWIRLMYCYEDRITDDLIETIAKEEKVCRYIDIPIQHCSDKILQAMNRRSTKRSIMDTIGRLREAMPDIHIRTTLITGFPGETQKEFEELYEFVETMKFERLGVFHYSKEEGTPAALMKGQVREQTKVARKEKLLALQRKIALESNMKKIGHIFEVLVEEKIEGENTYIGRTLYDAREIDDSVIFSSKRSLKPGDFVHVLINDAFDYDITGEETNYESAK